MFTKNFIRNKKQLIFEKRKNKKFEYKNKMGIELEAASNHKLLV